MTKIVDPLEVKLEKVYLDINEIEYEIGAAYEVLESGGKSESGESVLYVHYSEMYSRRDILLKEYVRLLNELKSDSEKFREWVDLHISVYSGLAARTDRDEEYDSNRLKCIQEAVHDWTEVSGDYKVPVVISREYTPEVIPELKKIFSLG